VLRVMLRWIAIFFQFDMGRLLGFFQHASVTKDGDFFRFCILDSAMRFLFFAYHLAAKHRPPVSAPAQR
jgi:hypothetical protein